MIKKTARPIALLGMMLLFTLGIQAQSIYFDYSDGTNTSYNLADVRKITFDADLMNLHFWDGSLYAWNVSTIDFYQYDETPLNVQEWLNNANAWKVLIFPNPTSTNLILYYNLPKEDAITIALFDMQGKLILQKYLGEKLSGEHHQTIDVNNLPEGEYVCRINGLHQSVSKTVIKN